MKLLINYTYGGCGKIGRKNLAKITKAHALNPNCCVCGRLTRVSNASAPIEPDMARVRGDKVVCVECREQGKW